MSPRPISRRKPSAVGNAVGIVVCIVFAAFGVFGLRQVQPYKVEWVLCLWTLAGGMPTQAWAW